MLVKSVFRQIRSSLGRFLAIFAIIALGVGFYVGLRVSNQAMMKTAGNYLEEKNFYDFRLVSTLGFTREDVEAFQKLDHVTAVEGSVSADFLYKNDTGADSVLHGHMLLRELNQLDLVEGRLPLKANECVLDGKFFSEDVIGTTVRLSQENDEETLDMFRYDEYRVVGIVNSPCYVNFERGSTSLGTGAVAGYVYLHKDGFDISYFTEIFLMIDSEAQVYTEEYEDDLNAVRDIVEDELKQRAEIRHEKLHSDAEEKIADAKEELADGWTSYDDEKRKVDKELADAKNLLDEAREELDTHWEQYREAFDRVFSVTGNEEATRSAFKTTEDALKDAEIEYWKNYATYIDNKEEADEKLADAYQELMDGEEELADAQETLADIEDYNTFVLDRSANVGYACLENDTNIVAGIAKVFPLFFFLVAALVCITTMTRMVQEQRTHNGVLKALGYPDRAIISQYLFYAGSASILGCMVGFLIGSRYMPWILWKIYHIMYSINRPCVLVLDWRLFAFCSVLYLFCALGATWMVCHQELREVAAELIRPKAPQAGKRVLLEKVNFVWKRLPFMHKVSVRNILRYKRRMIMMILGIGGCTALLLTGWGIRDSIKNIVDYQYEEISLYDGTVTFLNTPNMQEQQTFEKNCENQLEDLAYVYLTSMDLSTDQGTESVKLVGFEDDLTNFIDLHDTKGNPIEWPTSGQTVINYRLARDNHIQVGDTICFYDGNFNEVEVTVSGIFINYIYDYAFVSYETMEEQYADTEINTAYFKVEDNQDLHEVAAHILGEENVLNVSLNQDMRDRVGNMLKSMDYVVLIVLVCAGALAFIVLYNLTNISINERIREIATLKVLGFYPMETAKYVFRENLVLTAIAATCGIPMGIALLQYVMAQIQIKAMYFPWRILPISYVYAIVLTFVFAYIVAFFLYFRLEKVDMAESMKAIE